MCNLEIATHSRSPVTLVGGEGEGWNGGVLRSQRLGNRRAVKPNHAAGCRPAERPPSPPASRRLGAPGPAAWFAEEMWQRRALQRCSADDRTLVWRRASFGEETTSRYPSSTPGRAHPFSPTCVYVLCVKWCYTYQYGKNTDWNKQINGLYRLVILEIVHL